MDYPMSLASSITPFIIFQENPILRADALSRSYGEEGKDDNQKTSSFSTTTISRKVFLGQYDDVLIIVLSFFLRISR